MFNQTSIFRAISFTDADWCRCHGPDMDKLIALESETIITFMEVNCVSERENWEDTAFYISILHKEIITSVYACTKMKTWNQINLPKAMDILNLVCLKNFIVASFTGACDPNWCIVPSHMFTASEQTIVNTPRLLCCILFFAPSVSVWSKPCLLHIVQMNPWQ